MEYHIYHIPTFVWKDGSIGKIGCSKNAKRRVKNQGYADFEILETHTDKATASKRERELQIQYGYKTDLVYYDAVDYESVGRLAATTVNKNQGKINASNGHMSNIGKKWAPVNGKIMSDKRLTHLQNISSLGNETNKEKYGIKLIATNILTNKETIFNSTGEAEKALSIPKVLIRKCLNGVQSKSKGYTFRKL